MKIYISADMEGITAVSDRTEVTKGEPDYAAARARMSAEVMAACEGAFEGGATEVFVKDSHWTGRNLDPALFRAPERKTLKLIRGWSGHPFSMVQELDESFNGVCFVGYHSAASRGGNPLSHTISGRIIAQLKVNDRIASELLLFTYAASLVGVPALFLAGDESLCEEARATVETIETVATFKGKGASIISETPDRSLTRIREGMKRAVNNPNPRVLPLPSSFKVEIVFHDPAEAYRRSFYPQAVLSSENTVTLETAQYFEVLRALKFMTLS